MKTMIQAAVVTLFTASAAQAQQAVQWRVQDGGNGHWYTLDLAHRMSWPSARDWAESRGGYLATFHSAAEWNRIWAQFNGQDGYWIGFYQDPPTGLPPAEGWRWVTDEPVTFTAWAWGEPNDWIGYQQWVCQAGNAAWDDTIPDGAGVPIIEWSADCNNDGIVDYGQILQGNLADANSNNVPDRCECGAFPTLPSCCLGDLNADRSVDGADLGALLFAWGPAVPQSPADLDGDGQVGGADLGQLLFGWGACPVATPPWATLLEALPDPAVVTDPSLRSAIAATGLAWRVRDIGTGIEMLLVPPGTFDMGCIMGSMQLGCDVVEQPVHQVTLSKAFYLGRFEVTQAQWAAKIGSNPSYFSFVTSEVPEARVASRPVETVSWLTIQSFLFATGLRLPTEAEWEYACRAGTRTPFHNGSVDDASLVEIAWSVMNSAGQTHPVGGRSANGLGFHDMLGNVWEWVGDRFGPYEPDGVVDPVGSASGSHRVVRGACWADGFNGIPLRSSFRRPEPEAWSDSYFGFRVARDP